jgi:DNA-binding GntR family transcriptional regulator
MLRMNSGGGEVSACDPADDRREAVSGADGVVQVLEDDILSGHLKPGDRLDEHALAKRLQVSRTPVREALRHLASSGLVEIRRNHGATVRTLTTAELIEMFQVMAELEGLSARLCVRRMSDEELVLMRRQNEECEERLRAGDHEGFFAANNAFHETIYSGSQNRYLQEEARKLRNRLNAYRRRITFQPRRMIRTVGEHWKIVEAIEKGEEENAHRYMREHVDLLAGSAADVLLTLESRIGR